MSEGNIPSINDFLNKSEDSPSVQDLKEQSELPSVEDFKEKKEIIEEEIKTDNWKDDYIPNEIESVDVIKAPQWVELIRMVNDVRESIPDIPEIKHYDDELQELSEQIQSIQKNISEAPEVKYYDNEIKSIKDEFEDYKSEKFIESVLKVQMSRWFGETFGKIDDRIADVRSDVSDELGVVNENVDVVKFEKNIIEKNLEDTKNNIENFKESVADIKDKIYKELENSSTRIYELRLHLKDDDRKLKKQLLGQYNLLKENIEKKVEEFNQKNIEAQNITTSSLKEYFDEIKENINNLPEIKYYDDDIKQLNEQFEEIKSLKSIVQELKIKQTELNEGLLNITPDENNSDPLTPINQDFPSLEEFQKQYRLFVTRVQQQLATLGGGGEVRVLNMDDVDTTDLGDEKVLSYDASTEKLKFVDQSSGVAGINTTSTSVFRNINVSGNVSIAGTLTYEDVTNVDSVGIITARSGVHVGAGLSVAGISTFTGAIDANGDLDVDGHTNLDNVSVAGVSTFSSSTGSIVVSEDNHPSLTFISTSSLPAVRYRLKIASGKLLLQASGNSGVSYTNAISMGGIGNIFIPDNDKVFFGTNNDAYIQHDNSNLNVINTTGDIDVTGNVVLNNDLDVDGHTNLDNVSIAGVSTFTGNVIVSNLLVSHDGNATISLLDTGHGFSASTIGISNGGRDLAMTSPRDIRLKPSGGEDGIVIENSGAVELYHNNVKRLETSSVGVSIPQDLDVDGHTNLDNVSIAGVTTFSGNVTLPDNAELKLGSAGEVRLLHTGSVTNFIISQHFFNMFANGYNLYSQNGSESIITAFQNGAVNLFYDNTKRFSTSGIGATVFGQLDTTSNVAVGSGITLSPDGDLFTVGVSTFTKINLPDSATGSINIGSVSDLQLFHNGTRSEIVNKHVNNFTIRQSFGGGFMFIHADKLQLRSHSTNEPYITCTKDGAVELFHNNVKTVETTADGLNVTGILTATTLSSDGDIISKGQFLKIENAGSPEIQLTDTSASDSLCFIRNSSGNLRLGADNNNVRTGTSLMFLVDGGEAMRIKGDDAGSSKVGIASAIPTSTLDVNGDVRVGSGITLSSDGDIFSVGFSTIGNGSSGGFDLYHQGVKRVSSTPYGAFIHGAIVTSNDIKVGSYVGELIVGTANEFTVKHDNANTLVNNTVGILSITSSNNVAITTNFSVSGISTLGSGSSGQVTLQYQGNQRLKTHTWGVEISGALSANNIVATASNSSFAGASFTGAIDANGDLDVDGHTELDNVNITGFTTFATGTRFFHHTPRIEMQGSNTATLAFVNATTGTTNSDGMLMGFSSNSQAGFINVNESAHGFILKTGGSGVGNERINISGVGTVSLRHGTSEEMVTARPNGAVELYHDNSKKLETSADGLNVTDGRLFLYNSSIPHIRLNKTSGDTASTRFIFGIATGNDNFITGSTQNTCCIKTGGNNMLFGIASDKKLEINSSGATVTGILTATGGVSINDGNLVIGTSGHGIDFSATSDSSGSTSSELLDDYEEGTWTPTVVSEGNIGTPQYPCTYTKIGRLVTINADIHQLSDTTSSTFIKIGGLPYVPSGTGSTGKEFSAVCHGERYGGSATIVAYLLYNSGSWGISFRFGVPSGHYSGVRHSDISDDGSDNNLRFTLTYELV